VAERSHNGGEDVARLLFPRSERSNFWRTVDRAKTIEGVDEGRLEISGRDL